MGRVTNNSTEKGRDDVLIDVQRRRRWTFVEKIRAAHEASAPGMTVSSVARKYGIAPSQLFRWRKVILAHGVESTIIEGQTLVVTEMRELKHQIRELERLLGKKTLENETLREAIIKERSKNRRVPIVGANELFPDA